MCKDVYSKLSSSPNKSVVMNDSESVGNKSDACSGHSSPQSTSSNKVDIFVLSLGFNLDVTLIIFCSVLVC